MAKRGLGGELAEIARLADAKSKFRELAGSLADKLEAVIDIISEADRVLGKIQTETVSKTARKGKRGRPKGKGKRGRPKGTGKGRVGRPGKKMGRLAKNAGKTADLSSALKAYRKGKQLNQEALAKELDAHVASIRAWEQGRSVPRKGMLARMSKLGIEVGEVKAQPRKPKKVRKASRVKQGEMVAPEAPQKDPEREKTEEDGS